MEDRNSIQGTMRRVMRTQRPGSPSASVRRRVSTKRVSSLQQRHPLGVNMSFGNSPSTVRQFRRVSPTAASPDLENDDPLQLPKRSPSKLHIETNVSASSEQTPNTSDTPEIEASRPALSRWSSNASTLAVETKEASLGRRLYTTAVGISCQEVLNETGNEEKREAVARLAEAFSDLESTDPEGLYHVMTSIISRMKGDPKLNQLLPQPPARTSSSQSQPQSHSRQVSGTASQTPVTPSKTGPKLVMAQNNPHLKSHRRRQTSQVPMGVNIAGSRDSSAVWSPRSGEAAAAEKKLSKAIAGQGQLEHTKAMADVMFERWCEGLRNRWPAV